MTGNIHPMEERYQTKEMAELFTEELNYIDGYG